MKLIDWYLALTTSQKIGYTIVFICFLIVIIELVGLLYVRSQVGRYSDFWQQKAQEQAEITYVALGDSAAQGIGASSPMRGYVGNIAKHITSESGKEVQIINVSKTGAKLSDVLDTQLKELKKHPNADIVTIEIGANDLSDFNPNTFRTDFNKILTKLPAGAYVSDMPDFGGGRVVERQKQASQIIREEVAKFPELIQVDLQATTEKDFNHVFHHTFDFFHPNNLGYNVWSDAFISKINSNFHKTAPTN